MELIPAIDILDGKAVRLLRGRYDRVTVYSDDPAEPARRFHEAGARRLHVVDLDGAREGRPRNTSAITRILAATPLDVEVGGGIRDLDTARKWLEMGVRVVLGTAVIRAPAFVEEVCEHAPGRVIVALDARAGKVAIEGWTQATGRGLSEVARQVERWGVGEIIYTRIESDGMASGPDVAGTAALQRDCSGMVIASGGIGSLDHLRSLASANIRAAICGTALYEGAFTFTEAVAAAGGV